MDYVDDAQGDFVNLEQLPLEQSDKDLLTALMVQIFGRYSPRRMRYVLVPRGLSTAIKIVAKPECLFPVLVKLDNAITIKNEEAGDVLIRHRMPPLSIPPLEGVYYNGDRAALACRYITGGRVRHLVRRLDTAFRELSTYTILAIIDDIFDVILKKCHWLDGQYQMRPIQLPDLMTRPELNSDSQWNELLTIYQEIRNLCLELVAPHAIVHGDLHAKNVLVTRDKTPVLIDFSMAKKNTCIYIDFAKLEANLQFQIDGQLAGQMWRIESLLYGKTSLVVPHSNAKLASCVQRVRSNLWQGCTRLSLQMSSNNIDTGYRAYLIYYLMRFYSRVNNSTDARQRAYHQILGLYSGIHV